MNIKGKLTTKYAGIPAILIIVALLAGAGIASAQLLQKYVTVGGSTDVNQSVVFESGSTSAAFSWNGGNVNGQTYVDQFCIKNRAEVSAEVGFETTQNWLDHSNGQYVDGITTRYVEYFDDAGADISTYNEEDVNPDIVVDADGGGDYTSVIEGINNLGDDETLFIREGTYNESHGTTVEDFSNIEIIGAGMDKVTINRQGDANRGMTFGESSDSNGLVLKGFTLKNLGEANVAYGLKIGGSGTVMTGVTIEGVRVQDAGKSGIDLNTVEDVTIRDVEVLNNPGVGIGLTDSSDVMIEHVTTRNNSWGGLAVWDASTDIDNITVSKSLFKEDLGIYTEDYPNAVSDFTVKQSNFNCTFDIAESDSDCTIDAPNNYWGTDGIQTSGDVNASWKFFSNKELEPNEDDSFGIINSFDTALESGTYEITSEVVPK